MERTLPDDYQTLQRLARLVVTAALSDLVYSELFGDDAWGYFTDPDSEFLIHIGIVGRGWDSERPNKLGRDAFTEWARDVLQEYGIHQHIEQLDFDLVV